jgi:hypothetical protein
VRKREKEREKRGKIRERKNIKKHEHCVIVNSNK